jgi:DNA-binding ferritin-like protein
MKVAEGTATPIGRKLAPSGLFATTAKVSSTEVFAMSEKESITTLLTLLDSRQARLAAACKEIADWVDHQGGHPTALRIRDRLNDIEKDTPLIRNTLSSLKPVDPPLPRFR